MIIDGSTQPGYAGTPLITIDAAAVTTSDVMRVWTGGGGTTLRDFNVINAASVAVFVGDGAGDNLITNVHASWGGSSAAGTGFWITDSDNNTIREVTATNRVQSVVLRDANDNLVENSYLSGSGVGVVLALASSGNTIQNNVVSGSGFGVRSSSSGSGNRYLSNDLSQSTNYALDIFNESSFVVAGNDFTDSFAGVRLGNMDGLTLSPNPDFDIDVSTASLASYVGALALTNVTNSTISGFDLTSASAAAQGGAGLVVSGGSNNVIEDLTVTDRTWGVYANGGLTDTLFQRVDASWGGAAAAGTGFWITNSDNNTIRSATATNRVQAVVLRDANNNLVENSNLSGSGVGVVLALVSGGNTIHNNDGSGSGFGVRSSSS
ncbi:MAG: right-handed parallel beta-helix repeat-containing protein, partial [Pirellulaceae bacterium]|nr:right-handed parallel beta-helix repeat-containing protein [Pirellulaceae bacterium]